MVNIISKFMQKFCIIQYLIKEQKSNEIMTVIGTMLKIAILKMKYELLWNIEDENGFTMQCLQLLPKLNEKMEEYFDKKQDEIDDLLREAWNFSVVFLYIKKWRANLNDPSVNKTNEEYNREIELQGKKYIIKGVEKKKGLILLNTYDLIDPSVVDFEDFSINLKWKNKNKINEISEFIDKAIEEISKKTQWDPFYFCTDI